MPIYELTHDQLTAVTPTTFEAAAFRERYDLQRLLRTQIDAIVPGGFVLAEEFGDWDESRRSIDLLVLDEDATLVVVELKRTQDGGHMELQAIRYAAMVSAMTFPQAVAAHRTYLQKIGIIEDAAARILAHLKWDAPDADRFAQDVRIVLVSADFSKELTTAVLWLNERELDIRCVKMIPYAYGERTLLDIQQVIPLPEALDYQVKLREKSSQERAARQDEANNVERNRRFWSGLLPKANALSPLHRNVSPGVKNWIGAAASRIHYNYVISRDKARVEVYLNRPGPTENKAIYEDLLGHRAEIESAYGSPLSWERLDDSNACRIASIVEGSVLDESQWDELHARMAERMVALEVAFAPFIDRYRNGDAPEVSSMK